MSDVETFYDRLANDYHLVYADWRQSVRRQGDVLDALIRSQLGGSTRRILDCSCGIGTQAIGLALHGHALHATDISAESIDRAKREALSFDVNITFDVADMRKLADTVPGTFDAVLSCDNSLPHLSTDDDLRAAAENMHQKVAPNGMVVIGIRDYDDLVLTHPHITTPQVGHHDGNTTIIFQHWDWAEDKHAYDLTLFVIKQPDSSWDMTCHTTRYRALLRNELTNMLVETGFADVQWHFPDSTGHHQPLVTARAGIAN